MDAQREKEIEYVQRLTDEIISLARDQGFSAETLHSSAMLCLIRVSYVLSIPPDLLLDTFKKIHCSYAEKFDYYQKKYDEMYESDNQKK
jgi:hypothetical protein